MKNRRRIIIALVLVAVFAVGAVLYFTVLGPALEPEETVKVPIETQQGEAIDTTDRIQIFPRITAENVQSISVKNEYGSFEIYRDPNNDFRIKGHEHLSLRTTKVSELISIAGYPLARKKIDSSAQEYEQYGLNAPVAEWTITDKAGETHTLSVGHRLLTDDGYYICLDGRGAVYELSTSIETTILLQAQDYVNPLLMAAAPTNKYYEINRFTISHGKEKFISFSLVDEKDKKNPDSLAEAAMTYPAEYVPNEDRVWTVYSLMTGFSGESVVEIGADEKVYAEYGLDDPEYTVAFEYDGKAYVIFFSGLTEDGYYYASSSIVPDTVVKVAADTAEFLSYDLFKWISPYPFGYYITQISSIGVKGGEYDLRFALKHSEDAKGNDVLEVASNDGTDFAPEEMVKNFRMYYKAMLGVEMIDYTGLSAEENAALAADSSNMMYSFTYTTLSGKETTIAFYPYSTRRCLVTINGKGEFYVLIDRVEKMISDTGKLLRGEEIDSFAKN